MKNKIISILIILVGLCMVLYPWISNYMNDRMEKSTIEAYKDEIEGKSEKEKEAILKEARGYNKALVKANIQLTDPFQEQIQGDVYPYKYSKLLNLSKTGVMGVIDIPCINVNLPIYHGTSDVYMPILGSRITDIDRNLTQQELLDIMIASYILSPKRLKKPCTLHIICKKREGFSLGDIKWAN